MFLVCNQMDMQSPARKRKSLQIPTAPKHHRFIGRTPVTKIICGNRNLLDRSWEYLTHTQTSVVSISGGIVLKKSLRPANEAKVQSISQLYSLRQDLACPSSLILPLCAVLQEGLMQVTYTYGGDNLRHQLGKMEPEHCVKMMLDVLSALSFLHINQLVHRDIHPGNITSHDNNHFNLIDCDEIKNVERGRWDDKTCNVNVDNVLVSIVDPEMFDSGFTFYDDVYMICKMGTLMINSTHSSSHVSIQEMISSILLIARSSSCPADIALPKVLECLQTMQRKNQQLQNQRLS